MANRCARRGEAVRQAHRQVVGRGRGEQPEVFPLQTIELGKRLGKREAGAERLIVVVDRALRAAIPPCAACLLLGMTSGDLPVGSEEVVVGRESEDQIEQGMPLVVQECRMRRLGTPSPECRLKGGKVCWFSRPSFAKTHGRYLRRSNTPSPELWTDYSHRKCSQCADRNKPWYEELLLKSLRQLSCDLFRIYPYGISSHCSTSQHLCSI
jgi:hypothetical protein